jgi:hypothetical protein
VSEFAVAPDLVDGLEGFLDEARTEAAVWLDRAEARAALYALALRRSDELKRAITIEDLFEGCASEEERARLTSLCRRAVIAGGE